MTSINICLYIFFLFVFNAHFLSNHRRGINITFLDLSKRTTLYKYIYVFLSTSMKGFTVHKLHVFPNILQFLNMLLCSKSRAASLKTITLTHLKLQYVLLLATLMKKSVSILQLSIDKT